jgi:thiosulfate/3-mercaptopyruvate sulfurtransferase
MSKNGYIYPEVLVSTDWAEQHLDDDGVRFVEVDVDTNAYDSGHMPGAIGWNWKRDLQDAPNRDVVGPERFAALLGRSGIRNDTIIILYGDNNNWFAAYAFWLLKYYGHSDVRLMDGGRKKWMAENRPLTQILPDYTRQTYTIQGLNRELRALRDDVASALKKAGFGLVDVRSPKEFSGELLAPENLPQEGSQRGGHIPGAANIPWSQAIDEDGTFKSFEDLSSLYLGKGITPDKEVIAYCRIGERSSHTWFVLKYLLGFSKVRNYDGSWTEWGSLIGAPIEKN